MANTRVIETWRDPYGVGFNITRLKKIIFTKGVTILVGCNGAGKTTIIKNIEGELEKNNIPVFKYSDHDDGDHIVDKAFFHNDFEFFATAKCSSEGENITMHLGRILPKLKQFIITGRNPDKKLSFSTETNGNYEISSNERWILLDAVDSGYSIDNIIDLKNIFSLMIKEAENNDLDLYIIVSTNAYEFANGENCLDVISGKYITFESYDKYKEFILKSREKKENRYKKKGNNNE